MVDFRNISEFTRFLVPAIAAVEEGRKAALKKAAKIIEKESKRVIGTYDYGWPELKEATQSQRVSQGFSANEPLLRTGELRDSIGHEIVKPGEEAVVGSTSQIAIYQELGTEHIPPRSFLMSAAVAKEKHVIEAVGERIHVTMLGRTPVDSDD